LFSHAYIKNYRLNIIITEDVSFEEGKRGVTVAKNKW
jgi:hypothetical protein